MSHITTNGPQDAQAPELELLDCGQASKTTKGYPLLLFFELSLPPFDRQLLI